MNSDEMYPARKMPNSSRTTSETVSTVSCMSAGRSVEPRLHIRAAFLKELHAVDDENADKNDDKVGNTQSKRRHQPT